MFVTDADGIVLLASNPDWRFRAAEAEIRRGLRPARDPARDAMRFGVAQIETLALPWTGPAASRVRMIEKIQPIVPVGLGTASAR